MKTNSYLILELKFNNFKCPDVETGRQSTLKLW